MERKTVNTNPLDAHDPGIAVKYDSSFKTIEYFSTTDPEYLPMIQGGDNYLMAQAMVVRRGTTFNIAGPVSGALSISGTDMSPLSPISDPARGGWNITIHAEGTVGTYTATITEGSWSKSMLVYIIFELPTDLPPEEVAAFGYDDDPLNKRDEVAVWFMAPEMATGPDPVCPKTDPNAPCSLWGYKTSVGLAQAFWTEQFKKKVFVDQTINAINGDSNMTVAAQHIADRGDREFRVNYANTKNNWTSAMYTWNDGTGVTMSGGGCESTANVFVSMLRSAGIVARTFLVDYNKTAGHGEPEWLVNSPDQYDNSAMMWLDHTWKAERNYAGNEWQYYPWASGTTGIFSLVNIRSSGDWYYDDEYGDFIEVAGPDWDWQNGSNGGGMVNTVWPIPPAEYAQINRDVIWNSKSPLQITQSPDVEILNCQLWKNDPWNPSEWRDPPISNPEGRDETQTYILPAGMPDPLNPLENWPYNPKPTACSASTPTDVCDAFKASWTASCPSIPGSLSIIPTYTTFVPLVISNTPRQAPEVQLGDISADNGKDLDGDGRFDELTIDFQVTNSTIGKYQFGGWLQVGQSYIPLI